MDTNSILTELKSITFMESWMTQVFIVVFLTLLLNFIQKRMLARLYTRLERTKTYWDDAIIGALRTPLGYLIWIIGLAFAMEIIQRETDAAIFSAVSPARDVGVIIMLAWFVVGLITRAEANLVRQGLEEDKKYDRTTVDAIGKLLRASVIITSILVALQTLGFSISGVLAFGGIGGIAVGFAAKDLLANFFGGLMIYMDRPFEVGDWVRSPDRDIEGTVEKIGWRLTVIRTFDKRPLYIPNATFANIAVENPSRMTNRRIKETIGIRYDDAAKMATIVEQVKAMLESHEDIDHDKTLMVNFDSFGSSSLDFFIYTFTRTTDWATYHQVKQDVLIRILKIIEDNGAECAFPTRTLHLTGQVEVPQS